MPDDSRHLPVVSGGSTLRATLQPMSTQIQLYVRTDDVEEGHLIELGVRGPMAQLTATSTPSFDEVHELLDDLPNVIVGNSAEDFPSDVSRTFNQPREVTESVIEQVKAAADTADTDPSTVTEWLEDHRGEEVFVVHV